MPSNINGTGVSKIKKSHHKFRYFFWDIRSNIFVIDTISICHILHVLDLFLVIRFIILYGKLPNNVFYGLRYNHCVHIYVSFSSNRQLIRKWFHEFWNKKPQDFCLWHTCPNRSCIRKSAKRLRRRFSEILQLSIFSKFFVGISWFLTPPPWKEVRKKYERSTKYWVWSRTKYKYIWNV